MTLDTKINYNVLNWQGTIATEKVVSIKIADDTAKYVVHRALVKENNNSRSRTASTKTRSEVRGGGKKPWKQKGTGRARAGSSRSPLWKGGGVTFGPKPVISNLKMNKKEWRLALRTALYNRSQDIKIVEDFNQYFKIPKTKVLIEALSRWNISPTNKTLIVTDSLSSGISLSVRNVPDIIISSVEQLTVVQLLQANSIVMTVTALSKIQEVYND
uniref:Large ribosomal subunit protein uL4c n=1 Tax=Porphyridium purpureum TaxID=35688 RepID=W0S1U1_PORPP|nr:chloroplast 50S ribosomal protein L4 [Porphyridium purpureum]BAO23678.1 chloroplast 50S ribosomal protein L4 [Porphyridium purpureum]